MSESSLLMIRELEPYTLSFATAQQVAEVLLDAFQDDRYMRVMLGPRYALSVPPPAGAARDFAKSLKCGAYRQWMYISNPKNRCWVLEVGDQIVAATVWRIPHVLAPRMPLLHRLRRWLVEKWFKLWSFWTFFDSPFVPGFNPRLQQYSNARDAALGLSEPKYSEQELAHLSFDQLRTTQYPGYTYTWCDLLVVKREFQGHGYGKTLFSHAAEKMPKYCPDFVDGDVDSRGPAKLALLASRTGQKFYENLGFEEVDRYGGVVDGIELGVPLMVKVMA